MFNEKEPDLRSVSCQYEVESLSTDWCPEQSGFVGDSLLFRQD